MTKKVTQLICGACADGRPEDCSGWCFGVESAADELTHEEWLALEPDLKELIEEPKEEEDGKQDQEGG